MKGPSQVTSGSSKKKRRKQQHGAEGSPQALAAKGNDEVSNPPRKKKKLSPESSVFLTGKEAAGEGGQEGLGCGELKSRPEQHVSDPGEPISPLKKKKKKRRMEEAEGRCSGTASSGR